jgi:hypothetical protein
MHTRPAGIARPIHPLRRHSGTRPKGREPGIHNHSPRRERAACGYGFRVPSLRAAKAEGLAHDIDRLARRARAAGLSVTAYLLDLVAQEVRKVAIS